MISTEVWFFGPAPCRRPFCHWSWRRSSGRVPPRLAWCHGILVAERRHVKCGEFWRKLGEKPAEMRGISKHKKCCHIHPNGASIASYCSKNWWNMAHASNIKDHKTTPRLRALCLNCLEETILSSIFWVFSTEFWRKMICVKNPVPLNFNRKKPSAPPTHRGHVFHPVGCLHGYAHCRESGCMAKEIWKNAKKTQECWEVGKSGTYVFLIPIGSMYGIYGNMDPINIPQSC